MSEELSFIIKKALNDKIDAEIFHSKIKIFEIANDKNEQHGMTYEEDGYGLRIIKNKKLGFSYGNKISDDLYELAVSSSNASKEDNANYLPNEEEVTRLNGIFDEEIYNPIDKLKYYMESLGSISDKLNFINQRAIAGYTIIEIMNTNGLNVNSKTSFIYVGAVANYLGDEVGPEIFEGISSKRFNDINIEKLLNDLTFKIDIMKKRRKFENKKKQYNVIFTQKALDDLVVPLINHGISLESYYRNRTPFKLNDYFESKVTIVDDPLNPYLPWSREIDAEGLPSMKTEIIKEGVFKKFLSNTYWSKKANMDNTHSAFRAFTSLPVISTSNLVFQGKIINEDSDAIYIDQVQGVHTSNFETGDFSVSANVAWDKDGGFREIIVSGNIKQLINNVLGFTKDVSSYNKVYSGKMIVTGLSLA
ncbi:putative Zn-dependent protease-like protein [Caldisphaera lagunensis DSM 15908]|uniref:Putative Zn-dependent protease-like protein n=1 Tax=Caldisphaera lagunensis (strain DSM 15908 / JCM 11604 / ANMR 0165 / IC-154) TaxID=1056495 RepID=L0ACD3_CALLD|nr:TldD/PmbA family protein [Caldisphaera lagunensis]AFZ70700.1 putative Zn-dependent protease-like protein [Caldisphaera lagunensis DSM 15908]